MTTRGEILPVSWVRYFWTYTDIDLFSSSDGIWACHDHSAVWIKSYFLNAILPWCAIPLPTLINGFLLIKTELEVVSLISIDNFKDIKEYHLLCEPWAKGEGIEHILIVNQGQSWPFFVVPWIRFWSRDKAGRTVQFLPSRTYILKITLKKKRQPLSLKNEKWYRGLILIVVWH